MLTCSWSQGPPSKDTQANRCRCDIDFGVQDRPGDATRIASSVLCNTQLDRVSGSSRMLQMRPWPHIPAFRATNVTYRCTDRA